MKVRCLLSFSLASPDLTMATVYVLRSAEGLLYIGCTADLADRLARHNDPRNRGWTKRGSGWKVVYVEEYASMKEARAREKWMKSGVGREYVQKQVAGS